MSSASASCTSAASPCRIRATGWFDNTAGNPANPNPDTDVYFGLQTDDEMMIGYFEWMALD